jgi:sporulation protein YlmC with PRC-barrel domain
MATYVPNLLSTSTLSGDKVVNPDGEHLGEIKDFMVDLDSGHIAYAVLSFGGFLGMGNKLFAVPFESLRVDTTEKRFVLDVPKERLKEAPGFDKDDWPQHRDASFLNEVYTYYGYEPYETYRASRYGGYAERQRRAREGRMMDVIDADEDGV